jgi:hypothetical protein
MPANSLFKLRCVGLDPSEDRRVVDLDSAVEEHKFQIAVTDREHQIPSHGPKDRLSCELGPLKKITQTHPDARPIVPDSIIPELRQEQSLQQNRHAEPGEAPRLGISWDFESIKRLTAEGSRRDLRLADARLFRRRT